MTQLLLPAVPYDRTARRPAWEELPSALRVAIETRLGSQVIEVKVNGCGFTPGFVALLTTADGTRHFIKAASHTTPVAEWYQQEAKVTASLPRGLPRPALRWSADLVDHVVLCFEAIDGARTPTLPWSPEELRSCLEASAAAYRLLAEPTPELLALPPQSFATVLDQMLNRWRTGAAGEDPHSAELITLETRFDELTRDSRELIHSDLRLDNLVIDSGGKAWICDWSFLGHGPPWFDVVTVLLSAEASLIDVDTLFAEHPTAAGLPPDALDACLAAILGYYRHAGAQPEIETSPFVRTHQRYYAQLTWRWLARRQGWA